MFTLSENSLRNLVGVRVELQDVVKEAIKITVIDFGIPSTGGLRTVGEQNMLFQTGKSNDDGIENMSKHQFGSAVDFFAYVDGKASWDKYHLAMVAAAFLQAASNLGVKVKWGGLWTSFKDYPHIELSED